METKSTRKLIYLENVINTNDIFKYGQYIFRFKNFKPVPVEVPENIAKLLLKMTDRSCRCHYRPPKPLFKEVI